MATFRYDVLIIGSGAAGLTVALGLPDGVQAALLSKGELTHASTYYAQGGVAAVLDSDDSLESHVRDTHLAGLKRLVSGLHSAQEGLLLRVPSLHHDVRPHRRDHQLDQTRPPTANPFLSAHPPRAPLFHA